MGWGGLNHVTTGKQDPHAAYLGGEARELGTRAVSSRAECTRNRLVVDVPKVRHCETVLSEHPVEYVQADAGAHRDQRFSVGALDGDDRLKLVKVVQANLHAVSCCCGRERVARPHHAKSLTLSDRSV